ncbi:MAG TPA: imidazole glycerol phosphate synthase subunit HisH [Gemmatimonadaceae bacterium]|nr:imidazole glycerol phosphate synthase subunit HisH [Gemmatimonadaceae bacterium]
MITIVDYGVGNLDSIRNMLQRVGARARIVADPDDVRRADKLILPGVGAFAHGMESLRASGMVQALKERAVDHGVPTLGICLGLQLMTRSSEEGNVSGLGWIAARTVAFERARLDAALRVPHMGWADVALPRTSRLFEGMPPESRFYFVHSFHVVADAECEVIATAGHGYRFAAALERDNLTGVQFHPEKSHRFGLQLLRNFAERY